MSLLLDALKRAEQEKLAKQGGPAAESERPLSVSRRRRPPLPLLLQGLRRSSCSPSARHPPPGPAPASARSDAKAAQNVFQAKESPSFGATAAAAPGSKSPMLWIVVVVIAVLLLGAGGYVLYQVTSFTPRAVIAPRARPAPIQTTAIEGTGAPASTPAKADAFVPTQQPSSAIQPNTPQAATLAADAAAKERTLPPPVPETARVRETVAALLRESSTPAATPPLRLSPAREIPRVSPDVAKGYRELMARRPPGRPQELRDSP